MGIDLIWDEVVMNVVHYRFQRGWTWEEFRQTALKEHSWGNALNGVRYDVIGDLREATIPSGTGFTNVVRLFDQGPANRSNIVVIGSNLARSMIQIGGRLYPRVQNRFLVAETLEDARRLIQELRAKAATD